MIDISSVKRIKIKDEIYAKNQQSSNHLEYVDILLSCVRYFISCVKLINAKQLAIIQICTAKAYWWEFKMSSAKIYNIKNLK